MIGLGMVVQKMEDVVLVGEVHQYMMYLVGLVTTV
jgi:hypothetical protein